MKKWLIGGAILALAASVWAAIGADVGTYYQPNSTQFGLVVPHSGLSKWVTVIDAGGVDAADASPVVNPDTEIDDSTDHTLDLGDIGGTGIVVRFAYRGSVATSPVIRVFGRFDDTDDWQVLTNKAGDDTTTLSVDTTNDSTDGTDKFTTVVLDDHYFDCQGTRYIRIGVQTAQSGGTASVSYIQAKSF